MEKKTEHWFDYDHIFDDIRQNEGLAANPVPSPVALTDLEFFRVYETETGPKWSCWVQAWFMPDGRLRALFENIEGGPTDLKPDYKWQFIGPSELQENRITRNYRCIESRDGGRAWRLLSVSDASDLSVSRVFPALYLNEKTLLGVGGVCNAWDNEKKTCKVVGSIIAARSHDNGNTWQEQVALNNPDEDRMVWCRPKLLRDGTIVLPAYGNIGSKGKPFEHVYDACLYFSENRGKSWSEPLVLARHTATLSHEEPEVVELENGDLLVMLRQTNPSEVGTDRVYVNCGQIVVRPVPSISGKVHGKWASGPLVRTHLGFRGFPALLRKRDGILICAGSGNGFNFSVDEGKTWSHTTIIADPKYNRHNHYPVLLELPDGRVLSIYHFGNDWPYPPPEDQWIHATTFRVHKT